MKLTEDQLKKMVQDMVRDMREKEGPGDVPSSAPAGIQAAQDRINRGWEPGDGLKEYQAHWAKMNFGYKRLPDPDDPRGIDFAKGVRAIAGARYAQSQGQSVSPQQWAAKMYGENHRVAKALAATSFADGGAVIFEQISEDIIEFLRPASVVRSMDPVLADLTTGKVTMPKMTAGSNFSWIGENTNLVATQPAFGQINLQAKKGGAVVPISNDFLRRANPRADQMIRDDVIASLAVGTDLAYIRGDGLAGQPKGMRNLAAAANVLVVTTPSPDTLANITTDLGRLVLQLLNNDISMLRPGWLMAPRSMVRLMTIRDGNGNFTFRDEMLTGRLWNWPFAVTTNIPINLAVTNTNESEVYLVDFADIVIGDAMNVQVDISSEAAYFDGSAVQAAFSLDQTVIRAIVETDIQARHSQAIAILSDVPWTS